MSGKRSRILRQVALSTVLSGGLGDMTAPTVAITSSESSPTFAATIPLTITFSEVVTGFVVGDITVVGCTLGSLTDAGGGVYTVTATPTANTITVDIVAEVAQDAAGNLNTAATQFSIIALAFGLRRYDFSDITKLFQNSTRTTPVTADGQVIGGVTEPFASKHAVQAGAAGLKPLYKVNIQNGKSAALFDGVDERLFFPIDFISNVAGASYLVVAKKAVDPPVTASKTGPPVGGVGGSADEHHPYTDGNIYDRYASTVRKTVGNPTPSMASTYIYDVVSKSGGWTARINGVQLFTTATNTVGYNTGIQMYMGSSFNGSYYFDGYIMELLCWDQPLLAAEMAAAETAMNAKWVVF